MLSKEKKIETKRSQKTMLDSMKHNKKFYMITKNIQNRTKPLHYKFDKHPTKKEHPALYILLDDTSTKAMPAYGNTCSSYDRLNCSK